MDNIYELLESTGPLPIATMEEPSIANDLAETLINAGIKVMEITLRSERALEGIKSISQSGLPVEIGAGTVLSIDECKQSIQNGAKFIVTPCLNEDVVRFCLKESIPIIPGCSTATEIYHALAMGINVIKFFPASLLGGGKAIKALSYPLAKTNVRFIPTGGLTETSIAEYVSIPTVLALGGSWICPDRLICMGDYLSIQSCAQRSITIWRKERGLRP